MNLPVRGVAPANGKGSCMDIAERQQIEISYWKNSETESPDSDSPLVLINKMSEAAVLYECIDRHRDLFRQSSTILELGAGQGWASCLVKKLFPGKTVQASDISPWAIASVSKWERIFQVRLDRTFACTSYEIPVPDASVDLIFVFAAAHHFAAHRKTLAEIRRVLKPGGTCLYLYEPACPRVFYRPAVWRVNRKRPDVPEDVLITTKITHLAEEAGLRCQVAYYTGTKSRGGIETIYYYVIGKMPFLWPLVPCTANFRFTKT
jgi:SAM-dependent methyltransferase